MIKTCILSIGSELLEGSVLDTNAFFLSKNLSDMGLRPACVRQVIDDKDTIINVIKEAALDYDIIFTTGGLGPTFDDLTSECVAIAANVNWERNVIAFEHMKETLAKVGVALNKNHYRQANLPKGAELFHNYSGTALGFGIKVMNAFIISMPGVPSEMKTMFLKSVTPFLEQNYLFQKPYKKEIHFANIPESEVDKKIMGIGIPDNVQCIINAGSGTVVVKLRGQNKTEIDKISENIAAAFPNNHIGDSLLPEALFNLLKTKNKTISFAESCTGGLISKLITDIDGSSAVFIGGVVSYANYLKEQVLNVDKNALETDGAVSETTALQMAKGILDLSGSDYAVSVTGIAGPGGATPTKPVGTVYIAVVSKHKEYIKRFHFRGNRDDIRVRSAAAALYLAFAFINGYDIDEGLKVGKTN